MPPCSIFPAERSDLAMVFRITLPGVKKSEPSQVGVLRNQQDCPDSHFSTVPRTAPPLVLYVTGIGSPPDENCTSPSPTSASRPRPNPGSFQTPPSRIRADRPSNLTGLRGILRSSHPAGTSLGRFHDAPMKQERRRPPLRPRNWFWSDSSAGFNYPDPAVARRHLRVTGTSGSGVPSGLASPSESHAPEPPPASVRFWKHRSLQDRLTRYHVSRSHSYLVAAWLGIGRLAWSRVCFKSSRGVGNDKG